MDRFDDVFVSLPEIWEANALLYPRKDAVICGSRRIDWATLNREMNRVAHALRRDGIGKGARVAVLMSNSIENLVVMYGIVKAGACAVPLSPMLTSDQLIVLLRDCDPSLAFFSEMTQSLAEPIRNEVAALPAGSWIGVDFDAPGWRGYDDFLGAAPDDNPNIGFRHDDDFVIIYSSGTTGLPKGILQSHYSRLDLAHTCAHEMRFDHECRTLTTTSLYSTGTSLVMLPTMLTGGTLVVLEHFTVPAMLDLVARERITHTFLVPSQFLMILADPQLAGADLSSLKCMLSAGSPLRTDTKQEILRHMGPGLYELYGTSEGVATMMKPEQRAAKPTSAGPPMIGHRMKVVDGEGNVVPSGELGEIVGYSTSMMKCYYGKPAETAAAIWRDETGKTYFRTGDIGRMDEEQFITIVDRKKDMIISGGFNVYPVDIEAIIGKHEAVFDVTVIGIPHPKWDETPLALVILRPGAQISELELKEWANQRLARHQRVNAVEFLAEFPRNALGKVMKRLLRDPYWNKDGDGQHKNAA